MVIVIKNQLIKQGWWFPADIHSHFIFQGLDQVLKYSTYSTSAYATKHAIAKNNGSVSFSIILNFMNIYVENNAISAGYLMSGCKEGEADFDLEPKASPSLDIVHKNRQGELLHILSKLYKA